MNQYMKANIKEIYSKQDMEDKEKKSENKHKDFYVVKPQRGNIHGLMPQPPVKQSNMNERDTHSIQSTPSLTTRLSELPTLLSI